MNGKANVVRIGWLAVALLPLLIGSAGAANLNPSHTDQQMNQTTNPNQPNQQVTPSEQAGPYHPMLHKARDLIGAKVVNDKGEKLGTIWDIVLTPDHSGVSYVVLSRGWAWGTGGKLFAVPWSQLQFRPGEKVVVLSNVTKAELDQAKGFDPKHWPAAAEENWLGTMPEGNMAPAAPGSVPPSDNLKDRRVSMLTGKTVENLQGEKLGKLHDVVIDAQQGKVAFGILSLRGKALQMSRDYAAVPWSAFEFAALPGMIQLDTTPQTLASIAFKGNNFPDLADPQYSRQLYDRFHVTPYWEVLGFVPAGPMEQGAPSTPLYNPNAVETIHGTIDSLGTYPLPGTSVPGLLLNIRTDDGRMVAVRAGPRPYAEKENFVFQVGQTVTITGSPATVAGQSVLLASQIKLGDRTLNLLNPQGEPLWNINELQSANEAPSSREPDQSRAPVGSNY
jgi:sporulation protein YlmC with PRC-barrel domain